MAERSIGKIYVELDLDASRYMKSQQQLLKDATSTSLNIEKNFKNLGIKSSAEFDLMRAKITNSYNMIANSSKATANDIIRAERAKNETLARLNEQQFGKQFSLIGALKSHWMAASAAIMTVGYTLKQVFDKGFQAVETYNQAVATMGAMVVTFSERAKGVSVAEQWQEALKYSTAIVPVLENIAAKTLLSGQETTALANAFARSGVFLDASNQKQIESFTRISNALPLMTQGQEIMRQINSEMRAVMTGANAASSMMLQTLRAIDPELDKHLKIWREEGTVLEHLGDLLVGFGPATALLENQWQAVKSTIDTTVTQVLRGGMSPVYNEIIGSVQYLNKLMEDHKGQIQAGITVAWSIVSNILGTIWGILSGFGPVLKDVGALVATIAYGWGGVFAVLRPIGELIGNILVQTYETGKILKNVVVMAGAVAIGQFDVAKTAYAEAEKSAAKIGELSKKNFDLITSGVADSISAYEKQTKAALSSSINLVDASKKWKAATIKDTEENKKAAEKAAKEMAKIQESAYLKEMQLLEDRDKEEEAYFKNLKKEQEQAAKDAEKLASDRLKAERDIYKDLRKYSGEYFEITKRLIQEQADKYRKLKIDEAAIQAWVKEETIKAYIEMGQKSDEWATGVHAAFLEIQRDAMTWGKAAYDSVKTFSQSASKTMSSVFFDGMKGKLKSFKDYWDSFADSMLQKFADVLAQMAVEWLMLRNFVGQNSLGFSLIGGMTGMGGGAAAAGAGSLLSPGTIGMGAAGLGGLGAAGEWSVFGNAPWSIEAFGGAAPISSVLGSAGLGYLGGSMIGGMFGGKGSTYGGTGGALGAGIGSLFGPWGALGGGALGSLIGGGLGSLFGGSNAGFGSKFEAGNIAYGGLPTYGQYYQLGGASGNASAELITGVQQGITSAVQGTYLQIANSMAGLSQKHQEELAAVLKSANIDVIPYLAGVTDDANYVNITRENQAQLKELLAAIPNHIVSQVSGILEQYAAYIPADIERAQLAAKYGSTIKSAIESMRLEGSAFAQLKATAARLSLDTILEQAKQGNYANIGTLDFATLTSSASSTAGFATRAEYEANFYQTRNKLSKLQDIIGFAEGGSFGGGWRVVGERGPELEYTGPSKIFSNQDSRALVDYSELLREVKSLREDINAANYAIAKASNKTSKTLDRWDVDGIPAERTLT